MRNKHLLTVLILIAFNALSLGQKPSTKVDSLFISDVLTEFTKGHNNRRFLKLKRYKEINGLENISVKTEAIDWFGLYKNVVFEKQGKTDSIVYLVCHYDKVDGNIFTACNLMINGYLDKLYAPFCFSKGAYDNGTGVVSLLSLLHWINDTDLKYTYRFLFTGMEEYGLRGSRSHVSRIKQSEWTKCVYAINIDMIAYEGHNISISATISDSSLVKTAHNISANNQLFVVSDESIPLGASADFRTFQGHSFFRGFAISFQANFIGAFIPQRSYFTAKKDRIPTINFSDNNYEIVSSQLSIFSPIAFGNIHSFRDNRKHININQMLIYHSFFIDFIIENEK